MEVHIFTKQGKKIIESFYDQLDKVEFSESLPDTFSDNHLDFDYALVKYDMGHTCQLNDLESLIKELGKFGI